MQVIIITQRREDARLLEPHERYLPDPTLPDLSGLIRLIPHSPSPSLLARECAEFAPLVQNRESYSRRDLGKSEGSLEWTSNATVRLGE
jgi:hypothetical protein